MVDSLLIVQNVINVCGKSWTTCYGHKEVVTFFSFLFFVGHLKKGNIEFLKFSSGPADERLTYKEVRKEWPGALLFMALGPINLIFKTADLYKTKLTFLIYFRSFLSSINIG